MSIERVRNYPPPRDLDTPKKIEEYLKKLYFSLTQEARDRIVDFKNNETNSFKTITGITNDVVADSTEDSLTLTSANNRLTIVGTTATDTVTFTLDESKIDHGSLAGKGDNDHTQYILHSLADAENDFLVASGANAYVKKTLAETGAILETDINHDNLVGFVAAEHLDHTSCLVSAYLTADQNNLQNNTWTTVALDTENYDTGDDFNTTTHTFTAPATGTYAVNYQVGFTNVVANKRYAAGIYDGSNTLAISFISIGDDTNTATAGGSKDIALTLNDTLVLRAVSSSGDNAVDVRPDNEYTYMTVRRIA